MPKLTIDGVEIEAQDGQTVLQVALENGIHIPHFCYHPRLKIAGNCRMCLVEIEKVPKLQISCGTEVRDGMVVDTKSEKVITARRAVLEFLLINHPLDCPICDQSGECKLQDYCFEHGQAASRFTEEKNTYPQLEIGPDISRNM
ncbi:MAG: (2Fe-2S)-binding protein, partial [Deltaproteobacteria bacterium]|nr:(2Fe-2S)-binding protein [Deltaproteobacteria bacterium]